jgi:hypothetical protein
VKANKKLTSVVLSILIIFAAAPSQLAAQTAVAKTPSDGKPSAPQWCVQVDKIVTGDVTLEPAFRIAIYENLLQELAKTRRFKEVFRSGDRNARDIADLLILKTTVQKYTPGSETRRAVTTVSGATKLKVRSQLYTRDGRLILERVVDGNVRFFGGNLRATHNLARNIAKTIKQSSLPTPTSSIPEQKTERSPVSTSGAGEELSAADAGR